MYLVARTSFTPMPANTGVTASTSRGMVLRAKIKRHIVFPYRFTFSPLAATGYFAASFRVKKKKEKKKERKNRRDIFTRKRGNNRNPGRVYIYILYRGLVRCVQRSIFPLSNRSFCCRSDSNIKNFSSVSDSPIDYSSTRRFLFFFSPPLQST